MVHLPSIHRGVVVHYEAGDGELAPGGEIDSARRLVLAQLCQEVIMRLTAAMRIFVVSVMRRVWHPC